MKDLIISKVLIAQTTYNIGDVVRYSSSTYVAIKDRITNVSNGTDGTKWQVSCTR